MVDEQVLEWIEDESMRAFALLIAHSFHPRPLDARGVLIRTRLKEEELLPKQYLSNGWDGLFAQGLEIIQAPGNHVSLVRDPANRLEVARVLEAALDRMDMADRPKAMLTV